MNKLIYNARLFRFAKHLESITNHPDEGLFRTAHLYTIEGNKKILVEVKTHCWVFAELVACFPEEWHWQKITGEPYFDELGPHCNTSECVCYFFGINDFETYCHLWDLNGQQQIDKWGGEKLNENSDGPAIARNILEFVQQIIPQNG